MTLTIELAQMFKKRMTLLVLVFVINSVLSCWKKDGSSRGKTHSSAELKDNDIGALMKNNSTFSSRILRTS